MYLIPLALLIGDAVGLFVRGSFDYLLATRVVFWPIPVVGVTLQGLVGSGLGVPYPTLLTGIAMVLIAVTCAMNLHLTGASVVLFGTVLNLLPLVFNGYMPVKVGAVVKAGIADSASIDLVRLGATRAFETGDETLRFLGATVPIQWLNEVFSFGDLVIVCGLANPGFGSFSRFEKQRLTTTKLRIMTNTVIQTSLIRSTTTNQMSQHGRNQQQTRQVRLLKRFHHRSRRNSKSTRFKDLHRLALMKRKSD